VRSAKAYISASTAGNWKLETTMHKLLILAAAIHNTERRTMYPAVFEDASKFSQFGPDPHIFVFGFL
jgi:hypothetical protein